jgi:hypothetical protein
LAPFKVASLESAVSLLLVDRSANPSAQRTFLALKHLHAYADVKIGQARWKELLAL